MFYLTLSLFLIAFIALLSGYIRNRVLRRKIRRGELDRMPEIKEADMECCGRHAICEKNHLPGAVPTKIQYYDDEELDQYAGTPSGRYTSVQVSQFREILYTMRESDVSGWLQSLRQRGIDLPDELKDEVFLIITG